MQLTVLDPGTGMRNRVHATSGQRIQDADIRKPRTACAARGGLVMRDEDGTLGVYREIVVTTRRELPSTM